MKVLVTGGTGFLGRSVLRRLTHAGHQVRALVRPLPGRPGLPEGVESIPGDVTDLESLQQAARGCDAILHGAALVKMWVPDRSQFDRINVGGLINILRTAETAGVGRVVYTSSFIALGPTDGRIGDETQVPARGDYRNDYERTKALADIRGREEAARGAPLITLYPGVVYGPGLMTDGSIMTRTIRDFMKRRAPFLGSGDQRICYAYVEDVAEGHRLALEQGVPGQRYVLGGPNASYKELYRILSGLTGVPVPWLHVPFWLMGLAGRAMRWRAEMTGDEPMITDEVVEIYRHDWAFSSERAVAELGYRVTPLEDGLRRTIEWLKAAA